MTNTTHTPGIDMDKPCPYCGKHAGEHDKAYPHPRQPRVAEQADDNALMPRELIERVADRLCKAQIFPLASELRAALVNPPEPGKSERECEYPHETDECLSCGWRAAPEAPTADHESWMDCHDCDGYGRISSREKCARCNDSGILPDTAPATQQAGAAVEIVLQARSPEGDPWAEVTREQYDKANANGYETRALQVIKPAATAASASGDPFMWFDPAQVERAKLTDYADHIGIIGSSVKFGSFTAPLYRAAIAASAAEQKGPQ